MYKFAAASERETIVFGSSRPGYRDEQVNEWIQFMQRQNIQRVCCLLSQDQLDRYSNLLETYRQRLGKNHVCWTPIKDFHIVQSDVLIYQVLPFLATADRNQEKAVVHCSGGIGRTGHILAAWLVAGRGLSVQEAIHAVKRSGRNPDEAVMAAPLKGRNPWKVAMELNTLLDQCNPTRLI